MNLVLVLPGLLAPSPVEADAVAPALARILDASDVPSRVADGIGAVLAPRYGVARQVDWPLAPIRAAAAGLTPGNAYWLAADPVTLAVGQYDVRLAGAVTDLAADETAAFLATLNAHFAADGLRFVAPRPDAWFACAAAPPALVTHPLAAAAGRSLRALAPSGGDAATWTRWQHEIQMLLHEHPANGTRIARGLAPVNSVWFAEGGTLPARPTAAAGVPTTFAAPGALAAALAAHAGVPAQPLPAALDAALAAAPDATTALVVPDAPTALATVEHAWAAPAWRALARGRIATVAIVADGAGEAVVWTTRRPGFWRRLAAGRRAPALAPLLARARAEP